MHKSAVKLQPERSIGGGNGPHSFQQRNSVANPRLAGMVKPDTSHMMPFRPSTTSGILIANSFV